MTLDKAMLSCLTSKAQITIENRAKLDFIKIKNFCASEDSEQSEKRTHGMGKNI